MTTESADKPQTTPTTRDVRLVAIGSIAHDPETGTLNPELLKEASDDFERWIVARDDKLIQYVLDNLVMAAISLGDTQTETFLVDVLRRREASGKSLLAENMNGDIVPWDQVEDLYPYQEDFLNQ